MRENYSDTAAACPMAPGLRSAFSEKGFMSLGQAGIQLHEPTFSRVFVQTRLSCLPPCRAVGKTRLVY